MKKFLILILVIAAGTWGYFHFRGNGNIPLVVDTTTVIRGDLIKAVSATGTLQAVNTVNIGAQVSGTIDKIHVDYNSEVKKGDLLAEIDPSLLSSRVSQARANLLVAKANLREIQAKLANIRKTRDRNRNLFERDLIAESELDSAQTEYESVLAQLESARAKLAQAEADLQYDETNLGYTKIRSPIDGVVTDRAIDEGQTVNSSQSAPTLFTIAEDLSRMQVEADIDEADIGQVKKGQNVEFTVDAYPDLFFNGTVGEIRLVPKTQSNVVTYTVIVKVHNPDLKLMPGMTANISIISEKRENILKVNSAALRFQPPETDAESVSTAEEQESSGSGKGRKRDQAVMTESALWSYRNGSFEKVPVITGISDGMYTEVSGDIREGFEAVISVAGFNESDTGGSIFGFGPGR
jgi:HlyD family secretion protein